MLTLPTLPANPRRRLPLRGLLAAVSLLTAIAAAGSIVAPPAEGGWVSAVGILQDPGPAGFGIGFNGGFSPYPVMTTSIMPGDSLRVEALRLGAESGQDGAAVTADADGGRLTPCSPTAWVWQAPSEPGLARITVHNCSTGETRMLQVFILVPYHGETVLNGFPIGRYETEPLDGDPVYERPPGFIEVTPGNEDTWVSPHFQLKQFLCKQEGDYPKYLALRAPLLLNLERLHDELVLRGNPDPVIHVMSGYRTPRYNRTIGNHTRYSRHLYGDAADVFIDNDGDDVMDDWNGDGASSVDDAAILYADIESLHPGTWLPGYLGGLGLYGPGRDRGPFVHVDTRGSHARWGDRYGRAWLTAQGFLEDEDSDEAPGASRAARSNTGRETRAANARR